MAQQKIGGQARAMVVTNGVQRAIQYYHHIKDHLGTAGESVARDRGVLR